MFLFSFFTFRGRVFYDKLIACMFIYNSWRNSAILRLLCNLACRIGVLNEQAKLLFTVNHTISLEPPTVLEH